MVGDDGNLVASPLTCLSLEDGDLEGKTRRRGKQSGGDREELMVLDLRDGMGLRRF